MTERRILDVGCGNKKAEGAIGVDTSLNGAADVVADLNHLPWPFAPESFDEILVIHVIEHLPDLIGVMKEIHRVARPGAIVRIETPYFTYYQSWCDPTHVHHLTRESLDYFLDDSQFTFRYTDRPFFHAEEKTILFRKSLWNLFPRLVYRFSPRQYERYLPYIFPAKNLRFVLRRL